jgi:uncharacterized protein YdcH (DUF465 family)
MNFDELKQICKEHDEIVANIKTIESNIENGHWMKIQTPQNGNFYLNDKTRDLLKKHYEEKKLELENIINNILGNKED